MYRIVSYVYIAFCTLMTGTHNPYVRPVRTRPCVPALSNKRSSHIVKCS